MSTRSLDVGFPLARHHRNLSIDSSVVFQTTNNEPLSSKIDVNRKKLYEELATMLIEDKLLLTALELYAELGEAGHELLSLKNFFSNPSNFEKSARIEVPHLLVRSMSQTTLDSLDFPPLSEDGDKISDRVAVLEFELRKAKETIVALRENLTQQAEQDNASIRNQQESLLSYDKTPLSEGYQHNEPLKTYEQRAINFLVHEYLLTHNYRLSSITFSDENIEQDFENWEDVGLNLQRPPDLVTIFRHRMRPGLQTHKASSDEDTQTEEQLGVNTTSLAKSFS